MRRRTIFGPDMGNSDWTPIDEEEHGLIAQHSASPRNHDNSRMTPDSGTGASSGRSLLDRNTGYVLPEEHTANVNWRAIPIGRKRRADPYATFKWDAPQIVEDLKRDFDLTDEQAIGAVGNLGHESAGFNALQEIDPVVPGSRGGWGWAQWTGPRRKQFEKYAAENNLDPRSYAANYGYLKWELENTHKDSITNLKKQQTLKGAVDSFEANCERAKKGYKHMDSRYAYANRALNFYKNRKNLELDMRHSDWAGGASREPELPGVRAELLPHGLGYSIASNLLPSRRKIIPR